MIDVEQITVNVRMPSDEVRVVAMQPFIKLHSTTEEPFRWSDSAARVQLAGIHRTLDIARGGFGGRSANFTLFPEYAIPGIAGSAIINDRISANEWPDESIIIGGVHGISKYEYRELCDLHTAHVSQPNAPNSIPDNQLVNCCAIWVRNREGVVQKWVQPKILPALQEIWVTWNDRFCGSGGFFIEPSSFVEAQVRGMGNSFPVAGLIQ